MKHIVLTVSLAVVLLFGFYLLTCGRNTNFRPPTVEELITQMRVEADLSGCK